MHDGSDEVARDAVFAVSQTSEGHFLLGEAGVVTEDLGVRSTWEGQAAIAREVSRFLPSLARLRVLRGWAAPVAFTDDSRPLLGPVSGLEGLILATAFKSTVVVTPLVGSLVTQLVSTGRTDMDLTPFSPDRAIGHPGGSG
jgi:glycine/D-amino acid oxidase-like deaminating enzyme